jgi:rhomboid protease GluP
MQFYKARFDLAADDLATANHLATTDAYVTDNDAYVVIWLYLARMRIGTSAQDDFAQQAKALPADKWPMPVINFYLGNLKAAELTAAAANADPKTQSNQQCEASFYLGEWFLLHKDVEQAKKLLLNAQASCPKDFFEYQGSVAELKRLQ